MSVDFPAPFSPTIPCTIPRATSIETLSSAFTPGNDLLKSLMERMIPESFFSTRLFPFQYRPCFALLPLHSTKGRLKTRRAFMLASNSGRPPGSRKRTGQAFFALWLARVYHSGYGSTSTLSLVTTSSGMKLTASNALPSSFALAHSRLLMAMLVKLCPMLTACAPDLTWS